MPVHQQVNHPGVYFITFTCFNWLPLIEKTSGYDLIYNWFQHLVKNGNHILGYVIMPNHVHLLLEYTNQSQSLNTIIGNGKRFIGYDIVNRLVEKGFTEYLEKMKAAVIVAERQRNKKHQVWQGTFDVKQCFNEKFIMQKLTYIHNNPCTGKWKLSTRPHEYEHSSAAFYLNGKQGHFPVKDYEYLLADLYFGKEENTL